MWKGSPSQNVIGALSFATGKVKTIVNGTFARFLPPDKLIYANGNRVNFTVAVTDGVNPVSGVTASLAVVTANGRRVNYNATTDSNGNARFQYKISTNRDGTGTYTATVTGFKSGYNSGNGASATFTVR